MDMTKEKFKHSLSNGGCYVVLNEEGNELIIKRTHGNMCVTFGDSKEYDADEFTIMAHLTLAEMVGMHATMEGFWFQVSQWKDKYLSALEANEGLHAFIDEQDAIIKKMIDKTGYNPYKDEGE